MKFPVCIYGKPENSAHLRPSYSTLHCHEAFSDEAMTVFTKVRKSFNWRPGGGDIFPPCYAYWPLGTNKGLSFRFLDMGRDHFGRPHTLRLEAALLAGASWADVKVYLDPASWPPEPCRHDLIDLSPAKGLDLELAPDIPTFINAYHLGECLLLAKK